MVSLFTWVDILDPNKLALCIKTLKVLTFSPIIPDQACFKPRHFEEDLHFVLASDQGQYIRPPPPLSFPLRLP
jgi:hypothetical protein